MFTGKHVLLFVTAFLYIPFICTKNVENEKFVENEFTFKDFMKKYSSTTVIENINKARRTGVNITKEQEHLIMIDNIDQTDEIFGFDIRSLPIAKTAMPQRRWGTNRTFPILNETYIPTGLLDPNADNVAGNPDRDPFNTRIRLFALMQQAIYQAREKMTIMQKLRHLHKEHQLYKMGFLFSKTDQAAKTFSIFFMNAFQQCNVKSFEDAQNMRMFELVEVQERLENLWFDVDLLTDLINNNDKRCKEMLEKSESERMSKIWFDEYDGKKDWSSTTMNMNASSTIPEELLRPPYEGKK